MHLILISMREDFVSISMIRKCLFIDNSPYMGYNHKLNLTEQEAENLFTIAICDDNKIFCEDFQKMIKRHLDRSGIAYEIFVYHRIQNIRYDLSEGTVFDLLFLDIVFMTEKDSGVELGNYLRETLENEYSQIVYVSSKEHYAMKLFDSRPLNFLIKPLDEEKVAKVLDKVIRIQNAGKKLFTWYFSSKEYRIELRKILYFRSEGRKIRVVCSDGEEYFYYGKISGVCRELCDSQFFSPHKSYVVNYYAVEQWRRNELVIINGDCVPVSRNKETEIREMQLRYEMESKE